MTENDVRNREVIAELRGYAGRQRGALVMAGDLLTNGLRGDVLDYEHAIKKALEAITPVLDERAP